MQDRGPQILVINIISLLLCYIMIALRGYVRISMKSGLAADDLFALAALVAFTGYCSVLSYGAVHGVGQHNNTLSVTEQSKAMTGFYVGELFYTIATCQIKISFSLTLLRIVVGRGYRYIIYGVMAITVIFTVFYFIFILTSCHPTSYFWTRVIDASTGSCRNPTSMVIATFAHGIILCLGDLILAILPMRMVWELNMSRNAKISVSFLLALGSIASIATIARMPYVHYLRHDDDFLWLNTDIAIWSAVEVAISIITTSASTLRPLAVKYRIFSSNHSKGESTGDAGWSNRLAGSSRRKMSRNTDVGRSGRHKSGRSISATLNDHQPIARTASSEAIMWDGKNNPLSNELRLSEEDARSIPEGQILKMVEITATSVAMKKP